MARFITVIMVVLGLVTPVGSAEFYEEHTPLAVTRLCGDELEVLARSVEFKRTFNIVSRSGYQGDCLQLTELLTELTPRPVIMAKIMTVESNGDINAVGALGEVGLFQILPSHHPKKDLISQITKARDLLEESIVDNGSEKNGIRGYNGSIHNPATLEYYRKVVNAGETMDDKHR